MTTMSVTETRRAIADVLSTIDGLNVRPRPGLRTPKPGDGWVTVGRTTPSDFSRCQVVWTVVITLGADQGAAEDLLEAYAVSIIDAITGADFPTGDVALEPITLAVESGASLNALTVTLTTEVQQ